MHIVNNCSIIDPTFIREYAIDYIVHQCNCTTTYALGLARSIFDEFPEANTYINENTALRRVPGGIHIIGKIVNLYGQIRPGKPSVKCENDSYLNRLEYFNRGLNALASVINGVDATIAVPKYIGCGLAGGDWNKYLARLEELEICHPNISIVICDRG